MAILTAHTQFISSSIGTSVTANVAKFSASVDAAVTISKDSEINLSDSTTSTYEVAFVGAFKAANAKGSYGTAKEIRFYSSDILTHTITGSFPLALDTEGLITFPAPSAFNSLKLFKGNDTYIGSTSNDCFAVYDNSGRNTYYGQSGNDYIELASKVAGVAVGGNGSDLIVSTVSGDKLSVGSTTDSENGYLNFFWLGKSGATITDFAAANCRIVLQKSTYEEKLLASWAAGDASGAPVQFTKDDNGNYTIPSSAIAVVEGIKSSRSDDTFFVYDLGSGKLYFDQDGPGGKAPTALTTLSNKPLLTADEITASLMFAEHVENFRTYWLASYFSG
jgi:hypothetical protein